MKLKIDYPVYTFEKKLLLPAGTILTEDILESLITSNKEKYKNKKLLKYRTIKKDILNYFNQENYREIFQDAAIKKKVFKFMKKVSLPVPVLESIYYFRYYDMYTYRHMLMVFALSTLLAADLFHDTPDLIYKIIASPTHDIGKLSVPAEILAKRTALCSEERRILHHHPIAGYVLLSYYFKDKINLSALISRDHHERKDGSGYPFGIKLNDLMVEIVIVTDIYDALISPRSYRPVSYDKRTALEELCSLAEAGTINMNVLKTLISHHRKGRPCICEFDVSDQKRGTPPENNLYGITIDNDN
jgi:HD-GYP domain-containing protein (c-di-GMP phosphodiesterase class II)